MFEYNDTPIKFNIYTRAWDDEKQTFLPDMLTASLGSDGKMRLSGTASSSIKDLHGDEIVETGLVDMENAANNNLTIFGNHSYQVPEDVYGSVEAAVLARAVGQTKTGEPIHDLKMSILVNEENDRAVKTWKAIRKGTKLGLSIGAMIPEGGAKVDKKSKRLIIEHLDLLETSIVGIPANPRSWVDSARKSYFEAPEPITAELAELMPATINTTNTIGYVAPTNSTAETTTFKWSVFNGDEEPEVTDAACPTCGKGKGASGCDDHYHRDAEPEVAAAADPDAPTPEAPQSDPETDGEAVTNSASETVTRAAEVVDNLEADVTPAVLALKDIVTQLTDEVISAKRAKAAAEIERDAIVASAGELITKTRAVLTKLAEAPLGPRAAIARAAADEDLSSLEGVYSREFLNILRSTK